MEYWMFSENSAERQAAAMKASAASWKPRGREGLQRKKSAQARSAASQNPVSRAKKRNFGLVMPV